MDLEWKVIERGLWRTFRYFRDGKILTAEEATTLAGELKNSHGLSLPFFSDAPNSAEDHVRSYAKSMIDRAKIVLEKSGLPAKEGVYRKTESGVFSSEGELISDNLNSAPGPELLSWPNCIKAEMLSKEQFAVQVARYALELLAALEADKDKWEIASIGVNLAIAAHYFETEEEGIALLAERAIKSEKGAITVNQQKSANVETRRSRVLQIANEYIANPNNSKKLSRRAVADAVLDKLKSGNSQFAAIGAKSIRGDLAELEKRGQIILTKTGRSGR